MPQRVTIFINHNLSRADNNEELADKSFLSRLL